jgi:hypothetical protein
MNYFDLALPLSVLMTVGVAIVLRRYSALAVAASGFTATNLLAFMGSICAEAIWNPRPAHAWRYDSQYLDGAMRGLGAFVFYAPILQSRFIIGVASVTVVFAVLKLVVKQRSTSRANPRQFTVETLLAALYFCAVIAWFVQAVISVYAARQL